MLSRSRSAQRLCVTSPQYLRHRTAVGLRFQRSVNSLRKTAARFALDFLSGTRSSGSCTSCPPCLRNIQDIPCGQLRFTRCNQQSQIIGDPHPPVNEPPSTPLLPEARIAEGCTHPGPDCRCDWPVKIFLLAECIGIVAFSIDLLRLFRI